MGGIELSHLDLKKLLKCNDGCGKYARICRGSPHEETLIALHSSTTPICVQVISSGKVT